MKLHNKEGLQYVTFDHLEESGLVNHCFTTRLGGVSKNEFAELNMSSTRGESISAVTENYKILSQRLGFDVDNFVTTYQTHTTNIHHVTEEEKGQGLFSGKRNKEEIDALITNVAGINLTIFGADCVPIFFLDPIKKVIGMAHAGWRGTVNGISAKMVEEMKKGYGVNPADLLVGIGPSIGKCCFQVDDSVVSLFRRNFAFADQVIFDDPTEEGKYKIDLWDTHVRLLHGLGIKKEKIEISGLCTMCRTDLFYSHRVMGNARGNMAGVMTLLP